MTQRSRPGQVRKPPSGRFQARSCTIPGTDRRTAAPHDVLQSKLDAETWLSVLARRPGPGGTWKPHRRRGARSPSPSTPDGRLTERDLPAPHRHPLPAHPGPLPVPSNT